MNRAATGLAWPVCTSKSADQASALACTSMRKLRSKFNLETGSNVASCHYKRWLQDRVVVTADTAASSDRTAFLCSIARLSCPLCGDDDATPTTWEALLNDQSIRSLGWWTQTGRRLLSWIIVEGLGQEILLRLTAAARNAGATEAALHKPRHSTLCDRVARTGTPVSVNRSCLQHVALPAMREMSMMTVWCSLAPTCRHV